MSTLAWALFLGIIAFILFIPIIVFVGDDIYQRYKHSKYMKSNAIKIDRKYQQRKQF